MLPTLPIVTIIGALPLLVEGIAQALRSNLPERSITVGHDFVSDDTELDGIGVVILVPQPGREREVCDAIRQQAARGRRVLVLGHAPSERLERAFGESGANGYVSSHESLTTVVLAVQALEAGESYWTGEPEGENEEPSTVAPRISARERQVLQAFLGGEGQSTTEAAKQLGISEQTVRAHLVRIRTRITAAGYEVGDVLTLKNVLEKFHLL